MSLLSKAKNTILSRPFLRNLHELRFEPLRLIYRPEDLKEMYYAQVAANDDTELEHQIGRLTNFKRIIADIAATKLPGDVIEFGTWRGFSLLWIAFLLEREGVFNKKIIGIDGFVGLPEDEGLFRKAQFNDVTLSGVRRSFEATSELYDITKKNIHVEQYLFKDKGAVLRRLGELGASKFVFIHLDADLSSSTEQILDIVREGDLLADTCYLLFDDWGCDTRLRATAENYLTRKFSTWHIEEHSSTRLTKNFIPRKT